MSFLWVFDEPLYCFLGAGDEDGVSSEEFEKEAVHVAVGVESPYGITSLL